MKNIQVIDGADNCTFSLFQANDEEFKLIFPEPGQDIEFCEDLLARIGQQSAVLDAIWSRPFAKPDAIGLHGTLFAGFAAKRHQFPASKREVDWDAIDLSLELLADKPVEAARQVIDISGDGANNQGRAVTQARDEAVARGITISCCSMATPAGSTPRAGLPRRAPSAPTS